MRRVGVNQGVCSIPNTLSKSTKIPKYMLKIAQQYPKFLETVYTEYPKLVIFNINMPYTRFNPPPPWIPYTPKPLADPNSYVLYFSLLNNNYFHSGCSLYSFQNIYIRFSIDSVLQVVEEIKMF